MSKAKRETAAAEDATPEDVALEDQDEQIAFAGARPRREIFLHKPFGVLGDDGQHLAWGQKHTVSAALADQLVLSGRATDVATGVSRYVEPPRETVLKEDEVDYNPARRPQGVIPPSGRKVRVRVLSPFSFTWNGVDRNPGDEFDAAIERLGILGERVEQVDKPRQRLRPPLPAGAPHPIRILGVPVEGSGIWSVALDRQVAFGEEVVVPNDEAMVLIYQGRATSMRPELPSPAAVEFAELVSGGDPKKTAQLATLATKILNRNR